MKNGFLVKVLSSLLVCSVMNIFTMDAPHAGGSGAAQTKRSKEKQAGFYFKRSMHPLMVTALGLGTVSVLGWMLKKAPENNTFLKISELCSMSPNAMRIALGIGAGTSIASFLANNKQLSPSLQFVALNAFAAVPFWGVANSRVLVSAVKNIPGCSDATSTDIAPIASAISYIGGAVGVRALGHKLGVYEYEYEVACKELSVELTLNNEALKGMNQQLNNITNVLAGDSDNSSKLKFIADILVD